METTKEAENLLWIGTFTPDDCAGIERLRLGQARAIEQGDAGACAALCAADVHLMLPGRDVVGGRRPLRKFQSRLFRETKFNGRRKAPLRVERAGDLAVQVGRHEVATKTGAFAGRQKNTHVVRRTPEGGRMPFAVLMSNNRRWRRENVGRESPCV